MRNAMFPSLVVTPYTEMHLATYSAVSSFEYAWFTDWQLAVGVDDIRAVVKILNGTSTFQAYVVIQTAAVRTDSPGTITILSGGPIMPGETCTGNTGVSSYTGGQVMWFRLGLAYNNSVSLTAVSQADVSFQASWLCKGSIIDTTAVQLNAFNSSTLIAPLTRWFPAAFGQSVNVGYVCQGATGSSISLEFVTVCQTANTSTEEGGAWTPFGAYQIASTSPLEANTGPLSIANTADMWMRLGVSYTLTGSATNSASLTATVAARYT